MEKQIQSYHTSKHTLVTLSVEDNQYTIRILPIDKVAWIRCITVDKELALKTFFHQFKDDCKYSDACFGRE